MLLNSLNYNILNCILYLYLKLINMKKFLSIIVLMTLIVTLTTAQTAKKSFNVSGFNGINAGGVFYIELIKSNKEHVTVEAETRVLEYINVRVSNSGDLVLSLDNSIPSRYKRHMKPILVTVNIKELESLDLSGASRLKTDSHFTTEKFKAVLSGASKATGLDINAVKMKVVLSGASSFSNRGNIESAFYEITGAANVNIKHNCQDLKIEASGAAKINFEGSAQKLDVSFSGAVSSIFKGAGSDFCTLEVSGASNFNSLDFPIKEMDINLSGVSNAKIFVTDFITVGISGGSNIKYKGNPQIKSLDVSSISSFHKIN